MKPEEFVREWLDRIPVWSERTRNQMLAELAAVTQAAVEAEREACAKFVEDHDVCCDGFRLRVRYALGGGIRARGKPDV